MKQSITKLAGRIAVLATILSCLFLCACASTKTPPPEQQVKEGMTKEEVKSLLGDPNSTQMSNLGETWIYHDNAKAWIPMYGIAGGKFHGVSVMFDKEGKVSSWSTSKAGMY